MGKRTNGHGVLARSQPGCFLKGQSGSGGIDEKIKIHIFCLAFFSLAGVFDGHEPFRRCLIAFGIDGDSSRLLENDVLPFVTLFQFKTDLFRRHPAYTNPYVRRYPLIVFCGGDYYYFVLSAQILLEPGRRSMTRNSGPENNNFCHFKRYLGKKTLTNLRLLSCVSNIEIMVSVIFCDLFYRIGMRGTMDERK